MSMTTTSSATWALAAASAATSALAATSAAGARQERVPGHVRTAADALGVDTADLMSSLKSGQSLLEVADAQGVSREDLLAALKAGAPPEVRDSADADAVVEALASASGVGGPGGVAGPAGPRGAGGHPGHQGPPPPPDQATGVVTGSLTSSQQTTLSALSELLGTDSGSLLGQLQSGTDLTALLTARGVTLDQLSSTLEEGLLIDARA